MTPTIVRALTIFIIAFIYSGLLLFISAKMTTNNSSNPVKMNNNKNDDNQRNEKKKKEIHFENIALVARCRQIQIDWSYSVEYLPVILRIFGLPLRISIAFGNFID